MKNFAFSCITLFLLLLQGCTSYDKYYILDPNYLHRRQIETRRFEAKSEDLILKSAVFVLQDLGFNVKESDYTLGYMYAAKDREAENADINRTIDTTLTILEIAAAVAGGENSIGGRVYDVSQQIFVVLVTSKSMVQKGFNIRAKFARIICNNEGQCRYEQIQDDNIYQEFFDKLAQSLFLTANDI